MAISKFKATCLATLERVRRTGRPLRVTRFGKPVEMCIRDRVRPARMIRSTPAGRAEVVPTKEARFGG